MWPFKKHKTEKDLLAERIKSEAPDMSGLMESIKNINNIDALYKELCSLSHPDRFANDEDLQTQAYTLFKEVQANRYNYGKLVSLRKEIIETISQKDHQNEM